MAYKAVKKHKFPIDQVMQLSVAVDKQQGFIKSGYGYYDSENENFIYDNKQTIVQILLNELPSPEITDEIVQQAAEIKDSFRNKLIQKKLMGTLNDFESTLSNVLSEEEADGFAISIIASLPNSYRVQTKRDAVDEWFDDMRKKSEFVGNIGDRIKLSVLIKDVKFVQKFGIHLVTCVTDDENIIKFFFNREPDISGIIEGKRVSLTGKVKTQDVSKFSNCKETVFNYVKLQESA